MVKTLFYSPSQGQRLVLLTTCLWFFRDFLLFGPYTSVCISGISSSTYSVFAYSVVLFQCFRMVPVLCSSGGGEQKCTKKNHTPIPQGTIEPVRGCNFIRGIWTVHTYVYKTAGKLGACSCCFLGYRLCKPTGSHCATTFSIFSIIVCILPFVDRLNADVSTDGLQSSSEQISTIESTGRDEAD